MAKFKRRSRNDRRFSDPLDITADPKEMKQIKDNLGLLLATEEAELKTEKTS